MATAGHTGEYMFGSQAAQMTVLEKSNDTVTGNEAALKFAYDEAGKVSVYAGDRLLSEKETAAGEAVDITIPLQLSLIHIWLFALLALSGTGIVGSKAKKKSKVTE